MEYLNFTQNDQRQHFIPRSYLNCFTSGGNGSFHQLKLFKNRTEIKQKHIKEVCYETNFYDILDPAVLKQYGLSNSRFLETSFIYENLLPFILKKLNQQTSYLDRQEVELLIDSYISIKHRTPSYRKAMKKLQDDGIVFENVAKDMRAAFQPWIDSGKVNYDGIVENLKQQIRNDKNYSRSQHLRGLVESTQKANEPVADAILKILKMDIRILICPAGEYFFTSDNPGYSINQNRMFNTNYGAFDTIHFPISSRQVLELQAFDSLNYIRPLRRVNYFVIERWRAKEINRMTYLNADEKIFCENRTYLQEFKKVVDKKSQGYVRGKLELP
jgi:hypothetical protein